MSAPLLPVVQPILGQLPFLKHVFVSGGEPPPFALSFRGELRLQQRRSSQAADTCGDETAFWLYSSGSTGMPKGVRHVHSSPMETARLTGQGCLGMREDDLDLLGRQAVLRLRPRQLHVVSDVGRRHLRAAAGAADAGGRCSAR